MGDAFFVYFKKEYFIQSFICQFNLQQWHTFNIISWLYVFLRSLFLIGVPVPFPRIFATHIMQCFPMVKTLLVKKYMINKNKKRRFMKNKTIEDFHNFNNFVSDSNSYSVPKTKNQINFLHVQGRKKKNYN